MPPEIGDSPSPDTTETPPPAAGTPDVGNLVNAAVSAHLRRFTEKQFPTLLAEAFKPFSEQIAALKAPPPPPPPQDDDAPRGKTPKVDPTVVALQQQLEDFRRQAAESDTRRASAEKKSRDDRAFSDLRSHLSKSVRPEMLDMVSNHLFQIQKMVEVSEDGTSYFRGTRTTMPGFTEEVNYPLKDGVENWLKSEEAKPFLPAPGISNTPASRRQTVLPGSLPKDFDLAKASDGQKVQAAADMERQMVAALRARGMDI